MNEFNQSIDYTTKAQEVDNLENIRQIIESFPSICLILNEKRQTVLSNQHLFEVRGLERLGEALAESPGSVIHCINMDDRAGCGMSENCRYCSINNTLIESQTQAKRVSRDCRVVARFQGQLLFHDFRVTCSPVVLNNHQSTMLNLFDISGEKRNQMLENVFFHDILNGLGGLNGLVQLIRSENKQPELDEYLEILHTIGEIVIEDIQTQRFLKAAEGAKLIVNIGDHSALGIVESVLKQILMNPVIKTRRIEIVNDCPDFRFKTDAALLKRILLNMIKNAAEASPENGLVRITFAWNKGLAVFRVNNQGTIPSGVRAQIFQRSFSTKGHGRGLGTYSMKLFGENYLNGKVYFQSNDKSGTTFTIELPAAT